PENQPSSCPRFFPLGFSSTPRRISASVSDAINRSSSAWAAIQAARDSAGNGLVTLLIQNSYFVSFYLNPSIMNSHSGVNGAFVFCLLGGRLAKGFCERFFRN